MKLYRGVKFCLRVNQKEYNFLLEKSGGCRWLYNQLLEKHIDDYKNGKKFKDYTDMLQYVEFLEKKFSWLKEIPYSSKETVVKNEQRAFQNFFKSLKKQRKGEKIGFPKFKKKNLMKPTIAIENISKCIYTKHNQIHLGDLGNFKVYNWKNQFKRLSKFDKIINATIKRDTNCKWYVSLLCVYESQVPEVEFKNIIGVDLGIKTTVVLSNGLIANSFHPLIKYQKRLEKLQKKIFMEIGIS